MKYKNVSIIGDRKFILTTKKALSLIERKIPTDFNRINKYLKSIKYARLSRMILEKARFNVGKRTAYSKLEWYASTIVHDTYHYYLHSTRKLLWKSGNFTKHERLCINEQKRFLKKIKAEKYLIEWCETIFKKKYWTKSNQKKNIW